MAEQSNASSGWMGDASRGAALGQPSQVPEAAPLSRISLRRERLDSGGYDSSGSYWGIGSPLYWAADDSGAYEEWFRASDREAAKEHVRETYPAARFYR